MIERSERGRPRDGLREASLAKSSLVERSAVRNIRSGDLEDFNPQKSLSESSRSHEFGSPGSEGLLVLSAEAGEGDEVATQPS